MQKFSRFFSSFFILCLSLFAEEPLVVSLGCNCGLTGYLRESGIRKAAYPFDWILSIDFPKLVELFEDDFLYFLDDRFLVADRGGLLFQTYYHLEFSHEGDWKGANYNVERLYEFKTKYLRRIDRFRQIKDYEGDVFFIRAVYPDRSIQNLWYSHPSNFDVTDEWACKLYDSLRGLFPNTNFTVFILNVPRFDGDEETIKINDHLYIFRNQTCMWNQLKLLL